MGFEQKPIRMSITNISTGDVLTAQFNPTELQEAIQANWSNLRVPGQSHELLQFSHTGNLRYSYALRYSAFAQDTRGSAPPLPGQTVTQVTIDEMRRARRFLLSLTYPRRGGNNIPSAGPPRVLFIWPRLVSLTCIVKGVTFTHQRFNHQGESIEYSAQISMEEIRDAVTYAHYPPLGKRSQGGGQYRALWGTDYRAAANENIMVVAMIEQPAGVEIVDEVANLEGVDVVFVASSDLGSFTGLRQGHPDYEALVTTIKDATLGAGRTVGGPLAWMSTREGYRFFQAPSTTSLIRSGARAVLQAADPCFGVPAGVAPVEGEDTCP